MFTIVGCWINKQWIVSDDSIWLLLKNRPWRRGDIAQLLTVRKVGAPIFCTSQGWEFPSRAEVQMDFCWHFRKKKKPAPCSSGQNPLTIIHCGVLRSMFDLSTNTAGELFLMFHVLRIDGLWPSHQNPSRGDQQLDHGTYTLLQTDTTIWKVSILSWVNQHHHTSSTINGHVH